MRARALSAVPAQRHGVWRLTPLGAYDGKRRAGGGDRPALRAVYKDGLYRDGLGERGAFRHVPERSAWGFEVAHTATENDAFWANISSQRLTQLHAQRIDATLRAGAAQSRA